MDIALHSSITEIGKAEWDACFIGALEGYDYLLATETAGIKNFHWRYLVARNNGAVIAAIPAFFTQYHLDTTLQGTGRKVVGAVKSRFPGFMALKLACLGSPVTELGEFGFHPSIADAEKAAIVTQMIAFFETQAVTHGYRLIAAKDFASDAQPWWNDAMTPMHYQSMSGLPVASMTIDFTDMDAYFAKLSAGTRKDMRRKLRRRDEVRIEIRTNIDDVLPRLMQLYHDTRTRADMQFEELTPEFFSNVLTLNAGRSLCMLYYVGDQLLAFNLLLRDQQTLLDKYFCMDNAQGREFNLYFLSWFTNIEYCLTHHITRFDSGAAGYDTKLRLGSTLTPTRMAFKHKNRLIQGALRLASPLLQPNTPLPLQEAA